MNEKEIFYYKLSRGLVAIVSIMLIINGIYHAWQNRSSGTDLHQDTTRTVESIKAEHELTRSEVESAERSVDDAEEHVDRAADAISRSEDAAARNAAGVDQLQTLISECQGIVEAQQRIIRNVDGAGGARPAADAEN